VGLLGAIGAVGAEDVGSGGGGVPPRAVRVAAVIPPPFEAQRDLLAVPGSMIDSADGAKYGPCKVWAVLIVSKI